MARSKKPDLNPTERKRVMIELSPENYRGVKTISAIKQETMTQYLNDIITADLKRNKKLISDFADFMAQPHNN